MAQNGAPHTASQPLASLHQARYLQLRTHPNVLLMFGARDRVCCAAFALPTGTRSPSVLFFFMVVRGVFDLAAQHLQPRASR